MSRHAAHPRPARRPSRRTHLAIQAGWVLVAGVGAFLSVFERNMWWALLAAAGVFGAVMWPGWDVSSERRTR